MKRSITLTITLLALLVVRSQTIELELKVFLEGPYLGGQMTPFLNVLGYVPLSQPYNQSPWNYNGAESVTGIPNYDIVDWILVDLLTPAPKPGTYYFLERRAGFIMKDGLIKDLDGINNIQITPLFLGDYYVRIHHRNHLTVVGSSPLTEVGGVYSYDFTTAAGQSLGGNNTLNELEPGVWGMIAADGDANGEVNNQDKNEVWIPQYGLVGYSAADFDLNSQVDIYDKIYNWTINTGSGTSNLNYEIASNIPPLEPFNPTPYDGSYGISIDTNLSWSCIDIDGDPLTYSVYFGITSDPPYIVSVFDTSYLPGILENNTTYYWKIVVNDGSIDSTIGPIWSFNTNILNLPPLAPSNPQPFDGEEMVARNITLNWECSDPEGQELIYNIYFGTDSDPNFYISGVPDTSLIVLDLEQSMIYYWKITAIDSDNDSTIGPIWSFTTTDNPHPYCLGMDSISYDGQYYKTLKIGYQCWIKDNLNVGNFILGENLQTNNGVIEKYCYDDNPVNCDTYGGLYLWNEMMDYTNDYWYTQGICPDGWQIPTPYDWNRMLYFLDPGYVSGSGWTGIDIGDQLKIGGTSGFDAPLSGYRMYDSGEFIDLNNSGSFWSTGNSSFYRVEANNPQIYRGSDPDYIGFSVRCMKDAVLATVITSPPTDITAFTATSGGTITTGGGGWVTDKGVCWGTSPNPTIGSSATSTNEGVGDDDFISSVKGLSINTHYYIRAYVTNPAGTSYGNQVEFDTPGVAGEPCPEIESFEWQNITYNTVQIANQCWMKENLKATQLESGDDIPEVVGVTAWSNTTDPAYCWFGNDSTFYDGATYGPLYNWHAVNTGNLCPTGWHVPSKSEWELLVDNIGDDYSAGLKLKESGTLHWAGTNSGATNESGFTGLPGGKRGNTGNYSQYTLGGYWWTSSIYYQGAYIKYLRYNEAKVFTAGYNVNSGFSVRCIKD